MVAGIIRKLGVSMGENVDPANNEDRDFLAHNGMREMFTEAKGERDKFKYISSIKTIIEGRNKKYSHWGWKDPISVLYIRDLLDVLRSPVFIVVTRDPGAIAQREKIEEGMATRTRVLAYIRNALQAYDQSIDIIMARSRPTLLVSYERALRFPTQTGLAIAEFLGIEPPGGFLSWCDAYVGPDRLDGSIDISESYQTDGLLSASTDAVRALVNESLRVRRDGALPQEGTNSTDPIARANKAYEKAIRALNDGNFVAGEDFAMSIIISFAQAHPELLDGPIGVLGQSIAGSGLNPHYPDIVCGAFFVIGMSHVLRASAQKAIIYFSIAETMMRNRIVTEQPDSILSRGNYVSTVFHMGLVGKTLKKAELVSDVIKALEGSLDHRFVRSIASLDDYRTFSQRIGELQG